MGDGRVVITGATGFLGEYVVKELNKQHYDVIAVGRNSSQLDYLEKTYQVQTAILNLTDEKAVKTTWPKDADYCIHCAALSSVYGTRKAFYQANVLATKHVIEAAIANGMKRFVFVSSPSIYAQRQDNLNIKEDSIDVKNPKKSYLNQYIRSKIEAECLLKEYVDQIEIVVVRPRGLFGIGDTSIFPRLMQVNSKIGIPLLRKGQGIMIDVTCVENVAYALRLCLESKGIGGYTFNITNGEPIAFVEIMQQIFSLLGEDLKFRKLNTQMIYGLAACLEGIHSLFCLKSEPLLTRYTVSLLAYSQTLDITLAKEKLGYQPILSLEQGLKKYINSIKQNRMEK